MREKNLKLIMELIFIFILPLLLLCFSSSITVENNFTYDSNGNYEISSKLTKLSFDNSVIKFINEPIYINYLDYNQFKPISGSNTILENGIYNIDNYSYNIDTTGTFMEFDLIVNHHYYFSYELISGSIFNTNIYNLDTLSYINVDFTNNWSLFYTATDSHYSLNNSIQKDFNYNGSFYFYIIDLTQMFGVGYEPTNLDSFKQFIEYNEDTINSKIVKKESDTIISENYKINYTIWGKMKTLLIDNLKIKDSIILDIIICYTMLWFIMFVIWHFFYLFFDGLVHLFVDWKKRSE